jgi:hypothetical protein
MRLLAVIVGTLLAIVPWPLGGAAQAQTKSAKCDLPPPLVCPPDPPAGPKTVQNIDSYINSIDGVIATNEAAANHLGNVPINDYVGELKDYRGQLATYRDALNRGQVGQGSQPASSAGPP